MSKAVWHTLSPEEAVHRLESDGGRGLSRVERGRRYGVYGPNRLEKGRRVSAWSLFWGQFKDTMVLVLLGATVVSYFLGEKGDALAILAIVLSNAFLGFFQEQRAETSLSLLEKLAAPAATVLQEGRELKLEAEKLVPGDVVLLEAGDRVPADLRLLEAVNLRVEEAALTGESAGVEKAAAVTYAQGQILSERKNLLYLGTTVLRGRGRGLVVATGMQSVVGEIAGLIKGIVREPTPLQKRLDVLGKYLVAGCLGVCGAVVALGVWRGEPPYKMFLTGVSLAVAAIPEGLPAVVTIALAVGVQRMLRRGAIVRRLPAVETLGLATCICADKTGTITQNQMTVREIWAGGRLFAVSGEGYRSRGDFTLNGKKVNVATAADLALTLEIGAACNNARLFKGKGGEWEVAGDPTEGALLVAADKGGVTPGGRRLAELAFEAERRRMAVAVRKPEGVFTMFKGAPDAIVALCDRIRVDGGVRPLAVADREGIMAHGDVMAGRAMRVLAMAHRPGGLDEGEGRLVFAGLVGMMDPPRPKVKEALRRCARAGIRAVMITGDHARTALAVAGAVGMTEGDPGGTGEGEVITGSELERMSDGELGERIGRVSVFARVSPAQKLRLVRLLKKRGQVVAMTGDGVNDAPAIKEADIGVAMGRSGTDVAREAAQLVLTDDDFATVVAAVEEGRGIYDNVRKFIRYLLSCNVGEILVMFLAVLGGLPLPLSPLQLLWVNLVTDGLPAIALGLDPVDREVMARPPRNPGDGVFAQGLWRRILSRGVLIGGGTVLLFAWSFLRTGDLPYARTVAFATLVASQLFHVFDCRSERRSILEVGFGGNPYLLGAVGISASLLLGAIYLPALQPLFRTVALSGGDWLRILGVSALGTLGIGAWRWWTARSEENRPAGGVVGKA